MALDQTNVSKKGIFMFVAIIIAVSLIVLQIILSYAMPQELYGFYSFIGFTKLVGGDSIYKNSDYVIGNIERFDFENDRCKENYVEFWVSSWHFECEVAERSLERCYEEHPVEYYIDDGDLYQRTPYISGQHTVCATKIMDGYPANFEEWLEEQVGKGK